MIVPFFLSLLVIDAVENANPRYLDCLTLVEADLETGRIAAQQWANEGGAADAQHCLAMADIAAGFLKLGAARLEAIAERKDAGDDFVRARLLAQAAEAWLNADRIENATKAIDKAFEYAPGAGELHLTASKIHGEKEEWHQAVASVTAAEAAGFVSPAAYNIRAKALMTMGDYDSAAKDVVAALRLDQKNLDALVLRGELKQRGVTINIRMSSPPSDG